MAGSVALAFDILARDRASRELDRIGDKAGQTGGRIKGMASTAVKAFAGMAVASKALDFGKSAIAGAREAIAIDKQTEAVIKSTGAAAGITAAHVDKLSNKLQRQQTINDELIQTNANLLLTFKAVRNEAGKGNDVFDRAVALSGDMSKALGTDMKSSALQLGKALNDPVKGVSALQRVGVSFTAQQKEQIKTMVAAGDTLGAQKLILRELDSQFGGSAAAQASAADKLGLAWDDFSETIGRMLIPILDKLVGVLTTVARWAADNPGQFKAVAAVVGGALTLAFTAWAVSAAQAAAATIAATLPVIAITAAVAALAAGIIYAYRNWDWFRATVDTVARFLTGTLIPAVVRVIGAIGDLARKAFEVAEAVARHLGSIVSFVVGLPGRISSAAGTMFDGLRRAARAAADFVVDQLDRMLGPLDEIAGKVGGVVGKIGGIVGKIPGFASGVRNFSGGYAWVGERGPELLELPRGSNVYSNGESMAMVRGRGDVIFNVHEAPRYDEDALMRAAAWRLA